MAAVHAVTRGYDRVVTYGSSMGGYAAIRLAGLAGATCVLAMSPQYSIDPKVAGFDRRWHEASDRFRAVWSGACPFPSWTRLTSSTIRRTWTVSTQACCKPVSPTPPYRSGRPGTPSPGYLQEIGLLQSTVLSVCEGTLDVDGLVAEAWDRRERSPQHLLAVAQQTPDQAERIGLLQAAVSVAPNHGGCLSMLATELHIAGRVEESVVYHRQAMALHPTSPAPMVLYSFALQRGGDLQAALAVMEDVAEMTGHASLYAKRLSTLRALVKSRRAKLRWAARLRRLRWPWRPEPDAMRETL